MNIRIVWFNLLKILILVTTHEEINQLRNQIPFSSEDNEYINYNLIFIIGKQYNIILHCKFNNERRITNIELTEKNNKLQCQKQN